MCAFKMKVLNGGDNVTLRIWANGKTQVCRQALGTLCDSQHVSERPLHRPRAAVNSPPPLTGEGAM